MTENENSLTTAAFPVLDSIRRSIAEGTDTDIQVNGSQRQGVIHLRQGAIHAAHAGVLHGNGALLSLVQMQDATATPTENDSPIQKSVFLALEQLERFFATAKNPVPHAAAQNEEETLQTARNLFFRFQYKEAADALVTLLRQNRFFYPAWLWQSRLLTRQDYISRALDEAYRWGNHDQDIWREARKIRAQLNPSDSAPVKRCIFCWSLLSAGKPCSYSRATFTVGAPLSSEGVREEELRFAISCFGQAAKEDPDNARVLFALALAHYNLKENEEAVDALARATRNAPGVDLYRKSLATLESQVAAATAAPAAFVTAPPQPLRTVAEELSAPSILIVEDSMTSRKVLSMLLTRHGYRIFEAVSGEEAENIARTCRPNLIILDVMLPDTNGHELLTTLRQIEHLAEVPVVMLTGKHDADDRLKGLQGGVQEYLTKPFSPQRLVDIVLSHAPVAPKIVAQTAVSGQASGISTGNRAHHPLVVERGARPTVAKQAAAPAAVAAPQAATNGKTIFIIEDSRTSRKVLAMLLSRNGYALYEAGTGAEALRLAPSIKPDLVLLDVTLPDTTGYAILPQLKQLDHFTDLPVIMLTGNRKATDRLQGMLAGSNEYITKPFDPKKLLSVIGSYL